MFSRLENWLFLKTFCFLFYYCKDNTKIPIYVLKHSVNLLYLFPQVVPAWNSPAISNQTFVLIF